jgi:hypothetical protein
MAGATRRGNRPKATPAKVRGGCAFPGRVVAPLPFNVQEETGRDLAAA